MNVKLHISLHWPEDKDGGGNRFEATGIKNDSPRVQTAGKNSQKISRRRERTPAMDASTALSDDFSDYDVISDVGQRSTDSSIADLEHIPSQVPSEPPIPQAARVSFYTASLTMENIQAYVQKALGLVFSGGTTQSSNGCVSPNKTMRIYVDGIFDMFDVGHALQFRQAKLSFPSVYLMVGVFSDDLCQSYGSPATTSHVERCEVIRHCRWVDEVIPGAPWMIDKEELVKRRIDFVALDEGTTVDPSCHKIRLKGYDSLKAVGKVIPTRRTPGLSRAPTRLLVPTSPTLTPSPSTPVENGRKRAEMEF